MTLTLMQGITALTVSLGRGPARERLARDSAALRNELVAFADGLESDLELRDDGYRQRAYRAGCVLSQAYDIAVLPATPHLESDLARFFTLHQLAISAKGRLLQEHPGVIATPSLSTAEDPLEPPGFKPKSDSDYVATITAGTVVRTRRHETLVRTYGEWLRERGFVLSTPHPCDLVVRAGSNPHLVEVKVIRGGRVQEGVRAALGQLYTYRHFLYRNQPDLKLVALFSEPIGDAFVTFLETNGVSAVWSERSTWVGSNSAVASNLAVAAWSQQ